MISVRASSARSSTSVQLSAIPTPAGPRVPKRSLHRFPTIHNCVFLSPPEDTLNYVWLRSSSWIAPDSQQIHRCSRRLRIKTYNQKQRSPCVLAVVLRAAVHPAHPHSARGLVLVVSSVQHPDTPPVAHTRAQKPFEFFSAEGV